MSRLSWRIETGGIRFYVTAPKLELAAGRNGAGELIAVLDFGRDRIELADGFTIRPVDLDDERERWTAGS